MRSSRATRRLAAGGLLTAAFLLLLSGTAFAATFQNASPANGTILVERTNYVTFSVGATATAGQTLPGVGSISMNGGTPASVAASYVITGYNWVYDGEYGYWYQEPIYDYTQATYSYNPGPISNGAYTVVLTISESPSNSTFSYTWTLPAESCGTCHSDQPGAHPAPGPYGAFTLAQCSECHRPGGPVYYHARTYPAFNCSGGYCHGGPHGPALLGAHTHYDLEGNPSNRAAWACTKCHSATYPWIPQISAVHGSITGSKWSYKDLFDAKAKTEGGYDCSTCHGASGGPGGISPHGGYDTTTNKCKVCHAVHRAEGAYYLLRADSQDDACNYCHIGASAHSLKTVYDLNPAGTDTTNGHTIGAACSVPDSTVRQYATSVVLSGVDCDGNPVSETIQVRAYDTAKLQMYRFGRHHGQSDEGTGRGGYAKIGPRNLTCMNCHQTHNAVDEVWRPLAWAGTGWPSPTQDLTTYEATGYKLLRRYPSGTTTGAPNAEGYYNPGQQVKVIEGNAVKEGSAGPWGVESANFSGAYSAKFVYNQNAETAASPVWIAQDIHAPEAASYPTPGTGSYRYPYFNSKYALSWWCADCHNLNVGGWEALESAELGFKAHTERTHPAPFYGAYTGPGQCYSCHRNDLSPKMNSTAAGGSGRATVTGRDSCTQCHYGTKDYAIEMGNESVAGIVADQPDLGLDFPHSGRTTDIKLLGSYTVDVPAGGFTSGTFSGGSPTTVVGATITEGNLDAVCLRCHPGIGVHQ